MAQVKRGEGHGLHCGVGHRLHFVRPDFFMLSYANLTFFVLLLSFLCSMGQGMGKGRAWGSLGGPGLVSWPLREPDPFFMLSLSFVCSISPLQVLVWHWHHQQHHYQQQQQ